MKIFYLIFFPILLQLNYGQNNFISDALIESIDFSTCYVYSSLNMQNTNIFKTLYLNNNNNLYKDNIIQLNENIILNKLPQLQDGNSFLVLDENNQLGIYNLLEKNKSIETYDTISVKTILPIEKTNITIQNTPKYNISFNVLNQFYCYGKLIFLNGTIKTHGAELLINSLDKSNMISIPSEIITSGNIEYNGLDLVVDTIYSKKFFSLNNNIVILSPIEFENSVTLKNGNQTTTCTFEKNSIIAINKNFTCNNIPLIEADQTVALMGLNANNNPIFINTDTTTLDSTINIYAQSDLLTIGDNTYLVNISAKDYSQGNSLTLQKWKTDRVLLRASSDHLYCNFNASTITNLLPDLNGLQLPDNKYTFYGNGKILIEKINLSNDIHFQNKDTPIMLITSNTQLIDVSLLPTSNTFTSEIKQVVLIDSSGALGYINEPAGNEKNISITDSTLIKVFLPLYTILKNQLTDTKNIDTFITVFIKKYAQNNYNIEIIDNLFKYDKKSDKLAYNPIFAKKLISEKMNSLENNSDKILSKKNIKMIEEELNEALIKIKNFIEEIISINKLERGKII